MRIYTLFSVYGILYLFSALLFLFQCEDEGGDTRRNFRWYGKVNGKLGNYIVRCDDECVSCTAFTLIGTEMIDVLPKSSTAYSNCLHLPKSTDISDSSDTVTNLLAEFIEDTISDSVYGFDSWRKKDGSSYSKKVSYVSLKAGGSTRFKVRINTGQGAFDSFILKIEDIFLHLSFDSLSEFVTTCQLYPGVNPVTVYSHSDFSEGEAGFSVIASSRNGEICLAGDCETSEDSLVCVVYKEIIYNDYNLYHGSNFSPTEEQWQNGFDTIINQAVIKMGTLFKNEEVEPIWDLNSNGLLDRFADAEFLDPTIGDRFFDEFDAVILQVGQEGKCVLNNDCASFIINEKIRMHWIMVEDPIPDTDGKVRTLKLHNITYLQNGDTARIGSFISSANHEKITIQLVNDFDSTIFIEPGLPDIYLTRDSVTVYNDDKLNGETINSCSLSKASLGYDTHVHEFLHQKRVGPLWHVGDQYDTTKESDNIMYPYKNSRKDEKIRYRDIELFESAGVQSQWEVLQSK